MVDLFQTENSIMLMFAGMIGVFIGSFINVVIHRLPKMIERDSEQQHTQKITKIKFNLITPSSHCIFCEHKIRLFENIPILSYLMLKGRCSECDNPISIRYPFIEIISGIFAAISVWHFGLSLTALAAGIFILSLITLSMIDIEHYLLPDVITVPLLWVGLLFNLDNFFVDINSAVIGAVLGYLSLWSIYWIFKLFTQKEGMGYGDFKLFATVGAWLGWQVLSQIILIASAAAFIVVLGMIKYGKFKKNNPIPFGPFISIAAIIMLFID